MKKNQLILTDNPKFTCNFLKREISFKKNNNNSPYQVFFDKEFYYSEEYQIPENTYFNTIIINEFSHTSQFDILSKESLPNENIICFSDSGKDFHGFKNRKWETISGNFHLSVKISPQIFFPMIYHSFIILSAVIVCDTLEKLTSLNPKIKWVNDIMIDDAKIAGFITKTNSQNNQLSDAIIGFGVNIASSPELTPDKFVKKAVHINKFGYDISSSDYFKTFLNSFNTYYHEILHQNYDVIYDLYVQKSNILNKFICIYDENNLDYLFGSGYVKCIEKDLSIKLKNLATKITKGRIAMQENF